MARPHLRIQDGGHPAQGPVREMANPTPQPAVGNDFPDEPEVNMDERPQDQPDPDDFAALVGTDNITDSDGGSATGDGENPQRPHGSDVRSPIDGGTDGAQRGNGADAPTDSTSDTSRSTPDTPSDASDTPSDASGFNWRTVREQGSTRLSSLLGSASDRLRGWSDRLGTRN